MLSSKLLFYPSFKNDEGRNTKFFEREINGIFVMVLDRDYSFNRTAFLEGERNSLKRFFDFIRMNNPQIISFDSKRVILPLFLIRAMKYNLNAMALLRKKNDFDNYEKNEFYHLDLGFEDQVQSLRQVSMSLGLIRSCDIFALLLMLYKQLKIKGFKMDFISNLKAAKKELEKLGYEVDEKEKWGF